MRKYYIMKLNTTVIIIAVIALVLFVYYMASSGSIEMFQEGAGTMKTFEANLMRSSGDVSKANLKVNGRPIQEYIQNEVVRIPDDVFKKIIVNGNIQKKSQEYAAFMKKIVTTNMKGGVIKAVTAYTETIIEILSMALKDRSIATPNSIAENLLLLKAAALKGPTTPSPSPIKSTSTTRTATKK